MFTIIASQDRPAQCAEALEILAKATLLEAREFPSGAVIAPIVEKYDFLTQSNLYTE